MIVQLVLLLLFVLLALLFNGSEAALSHSDKLYFEFLKSQNSLAGKLLTSLCQKSTLTSGISFGAYLFFLLSSGYLIFTIVDSMFPHSNWWIYFPVCSGLVFFLYLIISFTGRIFFLSFPQQTLKFLAITIYCFYWIFYPLIYIIVFFPIRGLRKILNFQVSKQKNDFMYAGLGFYFQSDNENEITDWEEVQTDSEIDNKIFNNALSFKTVRVKECMVPRTEISAVNVNDTIEEIKKRAIESGHSKILVYRETIDDIIGYCHVLEFYKKPTSINEIISPVISVTETMFVSDLLMKFNKEHKSIALVIDEFGGTSGLITMEDVIEVIFGEIQDEFDQSEDWVEIQVDENTYLLSGRQEIHYLNEKYNWDLPEGDYETLGGLVMANFGSLPPGGTVIKIPPFTFQILSVTGTKIDTIRLTLLRDNFEE